MKSNIEQIMHILEKHFNSTERTTLNRMRTKPDPFKILISCLLSLRTQDKNTEIASNNLFSVAQNPESILKLPFEEIEKLIFSSGHYRKKARILQSVSKEIIERFK